jgi:DUF1680 family protein
MYRPDVEYMDYYEQALYNHILASVAEDNPGNSYHVPLNPGSRRQFGNANMRGFTCCNGTALESSTKLQDSIYFESVDHRTLYVNLFVPSTLDWQVRGVTITQTTSFPYSDRTTLTVEGTGQFAVMVRVPQWASRGVSVSLNGERLPTDATPGKHLTLDRSWANGDAIELRMPMDLRLNRLMDQPNVASIFFGPILLAAEESDPLPSWRKVKLNVQDIGQSIEGDVSTLRFRIGDLKLKPFFETYERCSVYLDIVPE